MFFSSLHDLLSETREKIPNYFSKFSPFKHVSDFICSNFSFSNLNNNLLKLFVSNQIVVYTEK